MAMMFLDSEYVKNFSVVYNETALMSLSTPFLVVPIYLMTLYAIKKWVKYRGKPYELNQLVSYYNLAISVLSAVLWFNLGKEIVHKIENDGFVTFFCDPDSIYTSGPLWFFYYCNYLFKYVELIDTCLLCLRGKPTPFLHVYHHSATLVLCWSQLLSQSCMQWVPIEINLGIHVVMYYYYFLSSMKVHVWWKKYLTQLQIVQFVVAVTACLAGTIPSQLYEWGMIKSGCNGTLPGAYFGTGILFSYLILFMKLYGQKYEKPKKKQLQEKENETISVMKTNQNDVKIKNGIQKLHRSSTFQRFVKQE